MAKSMSLLWGAGSPPCWRVMITLEEKKLQGYKRKMLSFEKGEHKSQEVLETNPRAQNQFKLQGNKLIPDSPAEQAVMFQRMMEGLTLTDKLNSVIYYGWLSVGRYPKLAKYYSLLKDRPSIKASWPPHWLSSPQGYNVLKDL
ncbi:hypothetical protein PAMA_011359 [Pampus argenteus]